MSKKSDPKKSELWRAHLLKCEQSEGTQTSYCERAGISVRNFNYWKQRFRKEDSVATRSLRSSSFVPVQVKTFAPELSGIKVLPDAKWVSEIIFELSKRFI